MSTAAVGEFRVSSRASRWLLVAGFLTVLEALVRTGTIDPRLVSAPTTVAQAIGAVVPTERFVNDLQTTVVTVLSSFLIGTVLGVLTGALLWRIKVLGRALEPFLVTLYALPTMVFYPMLLTIMGLGLAPIVFIAASMTLVPVALGVLTALNSVSFTLIKVGRSLNCRPLHIYSKIVAPAATPLAVPGVKLGLIYAVIWVVAMELIVSTSGLGYRIGAHYRGFHIDEMYAYIVVVMGLAIAANTVLTAVERRVRRDMS